MNAGGRRLLRLLPHHHRRVFSSQSLPPPPAAPRRRVVVTGLGMVTPLGCGVGPTWSRLIDGRCGIRALSPADLKVDGFDETVVMHTYEQLSSKVAGVVPCGKEEGEFDEETWVRSKVDTYVLRLLFVFLFGLNSPFMSLESVPDLWICSDFCV